MKNKSTIALLFFALLSIQIKSIGIDTYFNDEILREEVSSSDSQIDEFLIEFGGTELAYNNHVGNEWFTYIEINGTRLFENQSIRAALNPHHKITITCYLQEAEEKHIDSAFKSEELTYSELTKYKGSGFYIPVVITEGNDRYAGNTAQMNFNIYIK